MGVDPQLLGSYWLTCGPVEIHGAREWSLFDWPERCAQAARVGFRGLGIWHADLDHQLELRSLREIRQIFDDHGLEHLELEFLTDWFLDPGDGRRTASDAQRKKLWDAAAALRPNHIKLGNIFGTPCPLPQVTERFAELCADAARHHPAPLAYELMPFDVNAPTLEQALEIVEGAAAPNGGLALDTWHLGKLRLTPGDLRRIPRRYVTFVELVDGQYADLPDPVNETVNHRRLPGEGEFPIRGYVETLIDLGYDGPWGMEVLSEELRGWPITEIFDRAAATTTAQFPTARG